MKTYLGDGVYCEVDRGMFKVYTNHGMGEENVIWFEDFVLGAFIKFREKVLSEATDKPETQS